MRSVLQDVGYFFRTVTKAPAFFAVAVLTLALGIGANTAIFSVINAVLLQPLPFPEPERLVRLFETEAAPGNYPFTGPDYLDWEAQNRTLERSALFAWVRRANVSGGGQPESAVTTEVEPTFFTVLGVQPVLGRTFASGEGLGGSGRVAVLSYGFWQRHFGGDRAVVGRSIELDAERYTIIGVMPAAFGYPRTTEIWSTLDMSPKNLGSRGNHSYQAIARLKRGVSVEQALADLSTIAARLEKQFPATNTKIGASVVEMRDLFTRNWREPLLVLLGAVALVLLVACANVANLLLIRGGERRRELAIRSALGAGRARVVRQLLTESLLLALCGAMAGLAAAWWGVRLLRSVESLPFPMLNPIRIDVPVLLFTLGAALLTGLVFGLLPALQVSGTGLRDDLNASSHAMTGTGRRARRLRDAIAVAEIAVSLALLVGAALLLRTFDNLRRADIGIEVQKVLTLELNPPPARYKTLDQRRGFAERLLERVRATPGVRATALSTAIPLEGGSNGYITVPGQDPQRLANQLFEWNYVTRDYFRAFGIPLLQGRSFAASDESRTAAVTAALSEAFSAPNPPANPHKRFSWPGVVNRTMARMVWREENPIGKTFVVGDAVTVEVVGVVGDASVRGVRVGALPQAYFAFPGALDGPSNFLLSVRTNTAPMSVLSTIRSQLAAIDPTLAVIQPRTMEDVVAGGMQDTTLQASLLATFAATGVVLAVVGLYSVMAFLVAQRRREIGIRMALGAGRAQLVRMVLGHGSTLIVSGVLAGVACAWWLTRLMSGLLFGIAANDAMTFAAVSALLVVVSVVACLVPAGRAVRMNPVVALRHE